MLRAVTAASVVLAAAGTMQLRSNDFTAGGVIPRSFMAAECGGKNRSPQLSWSGTPPAVKSFALIVHDPDAPIPGGFYHWIVYNLPAPTRSLAPAEKLAADQVGETSTGRAEYDGPCPPPGPEHHYVFTLYALDLAHIAPSAPLTASQLRDRIAGHVVARALLTATAAHR